MKEIKRAVFYISFPLSFIAFIYPIYASNVGASVIEIGFLYSIFSVVSILIRPVVGNILDKKGRKVGLIIGTILYAIVNILFAVAENFNYLLVARVIQSLAASFLWISVDVFVSDVSNKTNRAENFGRLDQAQVRGDFLGCIIGFNVLYMLNNQSENPFKIIFMIFFIASLISVFYTINKVPETVSLKKNYESGKLTNSRRLTVFLVGAGILSFIGSLTAPVFIIYVQENIVSEIYLLSFIFIPGAILYGFLPRLFGKFADRHSKEMIVIAGILLDGVLLIFVPFIQSYYLFIAYYTLLSVAGMFYSSALSSLIIDIVGEYKLGRSYGLYNLANGVGRIIGPLAGAFIYENIKDVYVFYAEGALLLIMSLGIFFVYRKHSSRKAKDKSIIEY